MRQVIAGLEVAGYRPHALHAPSRDWPQTNCYTDLWIEVLHALRLPPQAALGFCATQDFEGDQFTFFKFPLENLEGLFGICVQELAIYDSVLAHVEAQIARGRLCLVEVDGFFLPDTAGVSYGLDHAKTTIAVNRLDAATRSIDYFHNDGFFTLSGPDFDGVFAPAHLFPYVEFAKLPVRAPAASHGDFHAVAGTLMRWHLSRAPKENPVRAWQGAIGAQLEAVAAREPAYFHKYAFNTARQLGANFELLASHLEWLDQGEGWLAGAVAPCLALSSGAKSIQFLLARAASRRKFAGIEAALEPLAQHHDNAMRALRAAFPA